MHLHEEEEEGLLLVGSKGHNEHAPVDKQGCPPRDDRPHLLDILRSGTSMHILLS